MANERSRRNLLEFLDYLGTKGLVAKNTVATRKAAASKVLGILSEEEAADVTKLDLDEVMARFQNLEGKNYTPGSLNTYLSRLRSSVDDFSAYLDNPLGFKPSIQARDKRSKPETKKEKKELKASTGHYQASSSETHIQRSPAPLSSSILPIPIRPDVTIYVQGIPYDLTDAEASKVANVIRAMASLP